MTLTLTIKKATLLKRYKRFLADVILEDGSLTTIHCANTGAMTGCATPGDTLWYSTSDNEKRKYPYSWELTETADKQLICVNTLRANQLVQQALANDQIIELQQLQKIEREVRYGQEGSKVDFRVITHDGQTVYIEVKSVTLLEQGQGYFPDAVTTRGQKHLRELIDTVQQGHRAMLLFAVLHSGINTVRAAGHIDSQYSSLLQQAMAAGVEVLAYKANFHADSEGYSMALDNTLKVVV